MLKLCQWPCRCIWLLISALTLSSCSVPGSANKDYTQPSNDQGEVVFYLQPLPQEMEKITFRLRQLRVIPEHGEAIPLLPATLTIAGGRGSGQMKLLTATLPPGQYTSVALDIEAATITADKGPVSLLVPSEPLPIRCAFTVQRGGISPLFLSVSPEFLVSGTNRFTPRLALQGPYLPPKNLLGFISNTAENCVTVFHKRHMEVVQLIRTGAGPKGMALDQSNRKLFVAAAGGDVIDVINSDTLQPFARIRLQYGDEPAELALSADGRTLISINEGTSTVSVIDTGAFAERERIIINPDPVWVVAGKVGQRAYVLHGLTNTVSVIDPGRRAEVAAIAIGESPWRATLSRNGDFLYIITRYTPNLLVLDVQARVVTDRIFIGNGSAALTVDPKTDLIYVGKKSGEIVVVDPVFRAIIDGFATGAPVGHMIIDGEENALQVLAKNSGKVRTFRLISRKLEKELDPGMAGYALAGAGAL